MDGMRLDELANQVSGPILFLTGAGISAESGIPTFRGPEGFWTIGSRHYQPEELATRAAFLAMPAEVWGWYLWRRDACRRAEPNAAHRALADAERLLGDRFALVTQNVDGLHLRAGNTRPRTHQIHGNIDFLRCARDCVPDLRPIPAGLPLAWEKGRVPGEAELRLLSCPACGGLARPHVLWFDESYDERHYRWDTSLRLGRTAGALVVIGTSGATNLPTRLCELAAVRGIPFVVVNRDPSPFSALAQRSHAGLFLQGSAVEHAPRVVDAFTHPG